MANAFNLTAQINLRGPTNLKPIVAQIKRELGTVTADVKVNIDSKSAKSIDNITARLRVMNKVLTETKSHTQAVNQALGSISSGFTSLKSSSTGAASGMNQALQTMKQTAKTVQVARTEMEEFGKQSYLAIKRFAAFSFVTTGIFALTNAVSSGLKAFVAFDKELVRLQQVTGKGAIGLKGLESEITRLSTSLGVSSESLMTVATTLAQAGLNANDTKVALEALAKTELAPSFDDLTQTTEGAIAALRQFELQTSDLEDALGSINSVAAAFAVESSDIITAIQRTGGVFAAASKGVSQGKDALNEFIAVFTSVRATTRESAETIATGLRTIFTRIQRARTIDQLKEFGVELTDLEGKFVGPYEAIKRLSSVLGELDPRDLRFSQIVEELGGFRQIGKVIPLIQQFATAQEALKIAQKGQGSLTEAAATAQKSLANQIAKVREQFLALIRDIGKSTVFQGLFKIVTNLASSLISLASAFKPILPILGILGAVKGASALTQFAGGFFGSMNKAGARGTGENLGASVSGTKDKERTDATNRATDALKANTAALTQLTSAVQALTSKIGNSGTATLNSGGSVKKFAGGGYVPGTGNRDTVPAMLTPGEFVIRKKAVETIGADKLHKMNKYAGGGTVRSKKGSKGYNALAPIIVDVDDRNIQASHVGMNLGRLNPKEVETYTSMPARRGFRSKKFDPEQTMSAGITASETFKLGLPTIANQNMKTGKPGVISGALRDWIRKNSELLFSGRGTIPQKALQVSPQIFAETFANALGAANPAVLFDKDLSTAFESVRGLLSPKYLESRSGKVDLFSRPAGEERSQIRHEGFDIKKISDRFLNGGFIQKFVIGGIVEKARQNQQSIQDTILSTIKELGGIQGVKKLTGYPIGDRTLDGLLRANNIKAGTKLDDVIKVMDKALGADLSKGADESALIEAATKFGLVGLLPIDYSKQFGPETIGGRSTYITARGLKTQYADLIEEMQSEMSGASAKFAEKIQMRTIFGGSGPLAFDFDETLVSDADIFDADGNIDIAGYSDLERVAESLKKGKLTRLGEELKARLAQYPDLLNNIRVLTARPQSNVPLLAEKLKQLGLNIPASKIKGVSGPQNKINDINELETLIDDRIQTIQALKSAGKKGIAYSPVVGDLTGPAVAAGQASIEGAVLEATLARLGAPLKPDAQPGRPIDYPDGLGTAAQYFGIDPNIPTEVKRTIDGSSLYRTRKEIERAYKENQFKLGGRVYDLQNGTGLSDSEFNELVRYGNTNDFTEQEFKDYLSLHLKNKASKKGLMMNTEQLRQVLLSGTRTQQASQKQMDLAKQLSGEPDAKYNPKYDNARKAFADGGVAEGKPQKEFGKIGLRNDGAEITATYFKNKTREGFVTAKKASGNLYTIGLSKATKGYGPKLYDVVMEAATAAGGMLTSDRNQVSDAAKAVWAYYFKNRSDVQKTPLDPSQWTKNQNYIDPKLYGKKETWPPLDDPAWILQSGYSKNADLINSPDVINMNDPKYKDFIRQQQVGFMTQAVLAGNMRNLGGYIQKFAKGGSAEDTVPALLTPGEFVINKKAAKKIGYAQLHRMNRADKIQGFNKGGGVGMIQRFADGGELESLQNELKDLLAKKVKLNVKIDEKALEKQIEDANRELQLEFAKFGGGGSGASRRGKFKAAPAQSGEELIQRYVESNPHERMGGLNAKEIERFKQMSPDEAKKFSLMENVAFGAAYQTSGGMIDAGRTGRGIGLEKKTIPELEKMATEDFGKKKSGLVAIEQAQKKLQDLENRKIAPKVDPKEIEDLDKQIGETLKKINDLKSQAASATAGAQAAVAATASAKPATQAAPPSGGNKPPITPPPVPPTGGNPPTPPNNNPVALGAGEAADQLKFFAFKAKEAGVSVGAFRKDLAAKVVSTASNIQADQTQQKEALKYSAMGQREELKGADPKKAQAIIDSFAERLQAIDPSLTSKQAQDAAGKLADGLTKTGDSVDDIIKSTTDLKNIFDKTYDSATAGQLALDKVAKEAGFTADALKNNLGNELKKQAFIQSEVGQKFGSLSEKIPGLLESFSKTKVGKGTIKAADVFSGTNLTQGLEKRLGESGKFIGDKINALGGPMVVLGGAVAMAADQITRNMNITDPGTAGAIGAAGGAGAGLASGALLGAQIAGPVGAMIAGIGGAIIGGVKGYFDAFNTKMLENNLKALDKSANELEIALKKLTIASNDATAAEVAKAAVGNQEAIKSTAQQAQLPSGPSPARGWLDFFRQEPTGLVASVTGAAQEGEARQAIFANVERALGAFEKLGERNLARSPGSQIRDVLNEANAAEATGGKAAKQEVLARANQTYQMMVRPESMGGGGLGSEEAFLAMGVQQARQKGQDPAKLMAEEGGREKLIQQGKELAAVEAEGAFKQQLLAESIRETNIQAENLIDIYRRVTANLERFGNELNNIKNEVMDAANAMGGRAATGPVDRTNEQILSNVSAYSQEQVNAVAEQVSGLSGDQQLGNQVKAAKILQDELPKILKNTSGQDVEAVTDQLKDVFKAGNIEVPPDLFTSIEDSLREKLGGRTEVSMSDIAGETDVLEIAAKVQAEALKVASDYLKRFNDALDTATEFAKNYASALDQADQMYMQAANVRLQADLKLAEALGNTASLAEQNAPFENQVRGLSSGVIKGGSTDPNKIFAAMQDAIAERDKMQATVSSNAAALSKDPANLELQKQYTDSAKALEVQNTRINNANKSLEALANDGSAAANALGKIQEQQRQVEGFGNFLEKVATADFDQLVQMRRESAALVVAQNSGPEFMQKAENRQLAFAGLNAQKELYSPEEFRNKRADLLTKFYQSQGFQGQDKVPALGGMTLDEAMKRIRGGVSEDDPNVKAYREATARQAEAADRLGDSAMNVATEFNNGLQKVMDKIATLPEEMKKARTSAEPEPKPQPEELAKDQQLVLSPEALALLKEGIKVNTLGLDPKITGQLDTTMQDLTKGILTLVGEIVALIIALKIAAAAYSAGGVGNLVSNVAGAIGGRRPRKGFGGADAPRAGSKQAREAAEKAGRKPKTKEEVATQRKRVEEKQARRADAETTKPKKTTAADTGTTTTKSKTTAAPEASTDTTKPKTTTAAPEVSTGSRKPSGISGATAVAGQVLDKAVDAASLVDEVVGVATSATNIASGQGTVQDVVYGASDAAELAGRGKGLLGVLKSIPGLGGLIEGATSAGGAVASRLGLGGATTATGGALSSAGAAIGVGKPIFGATGGVGAGLGNFAALNTAISAVTNAVEFMSDPAAYSARKQAQSDAGLERAQQRTGYGEFAGDSLSGALEGFMDPVGKIVEGGYVIKDAAQDFAHLQEAQAKTTRMSESAQKQIAESRGGGAIGKLSSDEQRKAMEEAQIRTELQAAQRVQATGGSLGDVAKIFDTTEQGLGATNLQDFIAKKESQLKTLPQERIDSRERAKDGTWDWSSNVDPKGFADAVSQEIQYRLSQIQLPPLPVKPEIKPEDQTKLGMTGTAVTTPEGKVAEQKTQTETSKAVDTMTSSTTTASQALESLSTAAKGVIGVLTGTGEKTPEGVVATDKKDTPAEVKSTVAAVAKTEAAVETESCECKILKEILAALQSSSINRQTSPTTSTPVEPIIPAPTPPGVTPSPITEPQTPQPVNVTESKAASDVARIEKQLSSENTSQPFVKGEDAVTRAEKQYAPTAERKEFVINELKEARKRQRLGQKLPTDDSVISASSFELANISKAEKTKKREQYLLKKNPKFREKYMTKEEKASGLAEKLADQPQLKEEPKPLTPYQQMLKGRRESYLAGKQSRRQAFLSRFRPEVRESMMTKEEKAARDKAQTQAAAQANQATTPSSTPEQTTTPAPTTSNAYDSLTPEQKESLKQMGDWSRKHRAELEQKEKEGTLTHQEENSLRGYRESDRINEGLKQRYGGTDPRTPQNPDALRVSSPQTGPTGLPSGGPTGGSGFQIQLDPNAQSFIDNLQNTFNSFNTYIDKLSTVAATIPSKIELTGNYTLDVQISGAAAFDALEGRMKELAVSLVEPKLQQLRDEVSAATGGTVKSSASMGNSSGAQK